MNKKHIFIAGTALVVTSALAIGLSGFVTHNAPAPTPAEAAALLALLEAGTGGEQPSVSQQGTPVRAAATATQVPPATIILTELDRQYALRASVAETSSDYIVSIANEAVPDAYAHHLHHVANLAHAEVRYQTLVGTSVYPLTRSGTTWIASIPKSLGFLPTDSVSLGAWEVGSSLQNEHDAVYWFGITLR
jgi:hypothetical protein